MEFLGFPKFEEKYRKIFWDEKNVVGMNFIWMNLIGVESVSLLRFYHFESDLWRE